MSNRRDFLLGSGLAVASLTRPAAASAGDPSLRAHLVAEMRKQMIPAMQIAVVRGGTIAYLETFGQADVENEVAARNATVFQIASCTKAFVGVALLQLVESGMLDLASPISRYLSDLPATWSSVTVGQVASHMSGLPDIVSNLADLRLLVEGDAQASWEKVKTLPLEFAPGEKFDYIQTNYVVLGKIIDALSREPFGQFIQKHQLDAVGMPDTVWGDDHDIVMHSARTYTPYVLTNGKPQRTNRLYKTYIEFPAMLRTCGGLNTTAQDLARWIVALQQGRLFRSRSSLELLLTARKFNNGKPGPWGIGGWVFERPEHPVYFSVGIAKSAFAIYPKDDLAVIALTNLSADLWLPFVDAIAAFYVPDIAK